MIEISTDIKKAKTILENDELVAIPTETVYGLAGNCFSEKAIKQIFKTKKRPLFNPLIIHIDSEKKLEQIAVDIPQKAKILAKKFWPGSLTLVLKKNENIPDLITAGKNTVAVRVPNHELTLKLLNTIDFPLAAPSANPFGSISPTTAKHVAGYFQNDLKMVLDGGICNNGIESTIIGFDENNEPLLYRLGAISIEEIEEVIGKLKVITTNEKSPDAPGMLSKHYAPKTKIISVNNLNESIELYKHKKIGVITFKDYFHHSSVKSIEILSKDGNIKQAARNLYAAMHRLDELNLDIIISERFPDIDLGKSINDRLTRATKN